MNRSRFQATTRNTLAWLTAVLLLTSVLPQSQAAVPEEDLVEGRGEFEMVLIHGLGSSAKVWDDVAPYLMGTFKVFRFELSGHGDTETVQDPTIDSEVARLHEFLRENDIVYPTLVGHGLGGMIALTYTLDHPADVHRLILMDTAPRQMIGKAAKLDITREIMDGYDQFVASRYLNMTPDKDVTERVLDRALRTDSASFISLLMSSFDYDETERLHGLSVPMLIIGSELMFSDPEKSREVLSAVGFDNAPTLSFKRMGRTGHFMMLEQPVHIASVLLAFGVTADYVFEE